MLKAILPVVRSGYQTILQVKEPLFAQPTRNTFILKRRWQPRLHKKNEKPHVMRGKFYCYDLVEDRSTKKRPDLEVVLTAFVAGVGDRGDIITVPRTRAYNQLLLPGLAVYKTDENLKKYASLKNTKNEVEHSSPYAARTVRVLEKRVLSIIMNKDEPWVLEPWHVRASLRKAGMHAVEEAIEIPKEPITGPDLMKEGKEFMVTITVNNLEKANVRCRIHHWSTDPSNRLPYVVDPWKLPAEPLFGKADAGSV
ncbi:39S ribosomal protein L9, mitochondrial [Bradysia coprophila]|uniref:39S ribosomal protein L9, mitochondrial n=1 Tax=Bradysia coprophila TaxID=38358 RepID=UPI00187D9D84|nr:39S ribosomal protein L9, mitochondrial [Bradysia coprophila]